MRKPKLPEWTNDLPNTTRLDAKEVMAFYGYSIRSSASWKVQEGKIVKQSGFAAKNGRKPSMYWLLGDLRREANV